MHRHPLTLAIALGTGLSYLGSAQAAADSDTTLETVVIEQRKLTPAKAAEQRLRNIPGGASVVSGAEVEKGRAAPQDIFAYQPGVFVQNVGGNDGIHVSIRGSGILSNVGNMPLGLKYLFDGLPLTGPGGASYELFEPLGLDHTEVLRGANAFDYGALSLGGAVNFVSRNGLDSPGSRLHLEAGSFGYHKSQLASGGVLGAADYYVNFTESRRDGFQDQTFKKSRGFSSNFGYRFSPDLETRLYLRYREEYHQASGALTRAQLRRDPEQTSAALRANRNLVDKYGSLQVGSRTTWQIDDTSSLEFGLGYYKLPQRLNSYGSTPSSSDYRDASLSLRYTRNDEVFGLPSESTLGWFHTQQTTGRTDTYRRNVDGSLEKVKYNRYKGSFDNVFAFGNSLGLTRDLKLLSGLSVIQVRRDIAIEHSAAPINAGYQGSRVYDEWSLAPRLGLTWQATPGLQLFANLSRSLNPAATWQYSPSTFSTRVNFVKPLVDQKANTLEFGLRANGEGYDASLAIYRAWVKDELLNVEIEPASLSQDALVTAFNGSPTIHQGVEASLVNTLWSGGGNRLSLRQAYTFNDFHFRDDEVFGSNQLPGVPRHLYQAELRFEQAAGFYAGLSVNAASSYYVDFANSFKADAYALLGARLGYDSGQRWSLFLDLSNLTDKEYASGNATVYDARGNDVAVFYPGDGRAAVAGVSYDF
ncbi:ligand-gated channel [Stutzerimonas kirkiae]|uniref:Ligand-gated channel n=1 Tax=Stutzerimonas kirkiae TaxID=2211392 RepID=A0A4Q9QZ19_9GAMM|nr:TonB-dependent receptor [Stutzerimonas kirkiae]TBU88677.1 ligand-gated channel [Stutzerimonas kirkiae]TBU98503.1 ligand-gated channel [Stutzerimonas kirkiae]TBV15422.1 ligand-gated channel [Stutzerimonas kirkiae]